jgi:hypothetical protein
VAGLIRSSQIPLRDIRNPRDKLGCDRLVESNLMSNLGVGGGINRAAFPAAHHHEHRIARQDAEDDEDRYHSANDRWND